MVMPEVDVRLPAGEEPVPDPLTDQVRVLFDRLREGEVPGSNMLGWLRWPAGDRSELLEQIEETVSRVNARAEAFVSIGIGGSYMGGRALVEALGTDPGPDVRFAGWHLGGAAHERLLSELDPARTVVNPISKSGTTLETASVFRLFRDWLETGTDDWSERVIVTTDPEEGALREAAREHDLDRFEIPPGIGGRYSVFTAVGLLPAAAAGVDVRGVMEGARRVADRLLSGPEPPPSLIRFVALRNALHRRRYNLDVMGLFYSELEAFGYWWQQLFGESEGKDGKGLYPDVLLYTRDLHSMGQYLQDGPRQMMETFLDIGGRSPTPEVPDMEAADGLDPVVGRPLEDLNRAALEGTRQAHVEGGVPTVTLRMDELTAESLGGLMYYLQVVCALSALTMGVNPFDQPGVEAYKRNVKRNLGL